MTDITEAQEREVQRVLDQMKGAVNNEPRYTGSPQEWLRDLRAIFPEPAAPTLADEIRAWADKHYTGVVGTGRHELLNLADCVEQIEQNRDEAMASEADHLETVETLRVEVGRLTTQVARQQQLMKLHGVPRDTVVLPDVQKGAESNAESTNPADVPAGQPWLVQDPADVPSGEAWWVSAYTKNIEGGINVLHGPAFRTLDRWCVGSFSSAPLVLDDDAITLLRRLVPAPRTVNSVEELDALPFRSVILSADDKNPDVYQRDSYDEWLDITAQGYSSSQVIRMERSVTVLYQPKEDQK